jgi:hypothetical protein
VLRDLGGRQLLVHLGHLASLAGWPARQAVRRRGGVGSSAAAVCQQDRAKEWHPEARVRWRQVAGLQPAAEALGRSLAGAAALHRPGLHRL